MALTNLFNLFSPARGGGGSSAGGDSDRKKGLFSNLTNVLQGAGGSLIGTVKGISTPKTEEDKRVEQGQFFSPAPLGQSGAPSAGPLTPQAPIGPGSPTAVGAPQSLAQPVTTNIDVFEEIQRQRDLERDRRREGEERFRGAVGEGFDPIFSELDRQLGTIPGREAESRSLIEQSAEAQRGGIESSRQRGLAQLEESSLQEKERTKGTLRDLEEDIRNQLEAGGRFIGSMGAGDSSATGQISEAITREASKQRGKVLETRNQALRQIDLKKTDVNTIAGDNLRQIDEWKVGRLFDVGNFFADKIDGLNSQLAQAKGEKARSLAQGIENLESGFLDSLRRLDDAVINFKVKIEDWNRNRQAQLQDAQLRLSSASKYTGGSDNALAQQRAIDAFGNLVDMGIDQARARQSVLATFGIDPIGGQAFTEEDWAEMERRRKAQDDPYGLFNASGNLPISQGQQPEQPSLFDRVVGGISNRILR